MPVVPSDQGRVRVDPTTGDRTLVSHSTIGSGSRFAIPRGIAVEADGAFVEEGYVLLNAIHRWFPEGFDTAALRDAKPLLTPAQGHMHIKVAMPPSSTTTNDVRPSSC
jgi:hypothetical protein